jgi:Transposase IS4
MAESQRPTRVRKKRKIWEAVDDRKLPGREISRIVASRRAKKTALNPILIEPIATAVAEQLPLLTRNIPKYKPPLHLSFIEGYPLCERLSELETFQLLFTDDCLDIIVANTNSYAENDREIQTASSIRPWQATDRAEVLHYIGCLFYMGMHIEKLRKDYWKPLSRLATIISKTRFNQLNRYLHIRDATLIPKEPTDEFY